VKDGSGTIHAQGTIPATRLDLDRWMKTLPQPWTAAMEATVFTGWIYDHLQPQAAALKVAHPLMLRAIAAAKKKNDRIDASKICDCLALRFSGRSATWPRLPFASGGARCGTQSAGPANGADEEQDRHAADGSRSELQQAATAQAGYFRELLATNPDIDEGLVSLLRLCRGDGGAPSENRECSGAIAGA